MTPTTIDLNVDAGEDPLALADGREAELVRTVTSVNAACGGHAGDARTLDALARLCAEHATAFNAHPSYPDREHFGRRSLEISSDALEASLREQLALAHEAAGAHGLTITRIKPHGALYHDIAHHPTRADTFARALGRPTEVVLPPTLVTRACLESAGHTVIEEGFADRVYTATGGLEPRSSGRGLITDPERAAAQAVRLAEQGVCRTICVHSDTPGAAVLAERVRRHLEGAGFVVRRETA